jgi:hypothetical protein
MTPRKPHKTSGDMDRAEMVRLLAALLTQAAPLVHRLDSTEVAAVHRARLRELVGPTIYFGLVHALTNMCGERAWQIAHAKDAQVRQALLRPKMAGVVLDRDGLHSVSRDDEPQ